MITLIDEAITGLASIGGSIVGRRNYFKYYVDMIRQRGLNPYDRNMSYKNRDFQQFFSETLTKHDCTIDGVPAKLVFQDHSQSNNKDLSDDKYIVAENDTKVHVGSYIEWADSLWLVFTEEHKTIATHQQLKIKHVNETIKWIRNGKVVNKGQGYGAYVQSQTLYTMGVAQTPLLDVVDSKMAMYMQYNEETARLKEDERVFIGKRVYKIKFMDAVSRKGLIFYLLDEDRVGQLDNVEESIADYYNYYGKNDDYVKDSDDSPNKTLTILGEKYPRIGRTYEYTIKGGDSVEWVLEHDTSGEPIYKSFEKTDKSLKISFSANTDLIGNKATIIATSKDGQYAALHLSLIKRF